MRAPAPLIQLDLLSTDSIGGPQPAAIHLIREIDQRQHALMTTYGGPPRYVTLNKLYNGAFSFEHTTFVPPGVTYLNIGLLVSGRGEVTITTASDVVGTKMRSTLNSTSDARTVLDAEWLWASGIVPDTEGAESARAILTGLRQWAWDTLTLIFDGDKAVDFAILGMVVAPIHLPA